MAEKKQNKIPPLSELTLIAIEAALAAGAILRKGFGTSFSIGMKEGHYNLVTEYDHKAEQEIIHFIQKRVPQSQFLAEESGISGNNRSLVWIIDPLDGTVNFARQIPVFSVSIGLEQEGKMVAGVVFQPMTHELFVAEAGKGAFLYRNNLKDREFGKAAESCGAGERSEPARRAAQIIDGNRLSVSQTKRLSDSILATGFPYNLIENPHHCIDHFVDILRCGIPIRRLGSAAIDFAYTAAGRFEGFFEVSLSPWDIAAGKLILEEAGGRISGWDGSAFDLYSQKPLLATNGHIHQEAIQLLNRNV